MNVSQVERLILYNQCRILANLYPEEQKSYEEMAEILHSGYELDYYEIEQVLDEPMSADKCREVRDILDLFRGFANSFNALKDRKGIPEEEIKFQGFDGNEETEYMVYTRFLIEKQEKWIESKRENNDYNTHFPILGKYRGMLAKWKAIPSKQRHSLTAEQLREILDAEPHP